MYERKYFRTLIVILLVWKITLCNSSLTTSILINPRQIIYEGKIVSIDRFLETNIIHSSTDTSQHPNLFYTARKCMYADTTIDLLQTFFEIFVYGVNSHIKIQIPDIKDHTINWLTSAINHFNNIKTPIAKMIDDLFIRSDKTKMLRTSDQSLLKSLLSINLFLHYSVNNNPFIVYSEVMTEDQNGSVTTINGIDFYKTITNVRVLNSSIIQMIGLVERFRNKRCVVGNHYKYNFVVNEKINDTLIYDVENIQMLIQPFLNRLNVLVNEGSDNYNDFNSKIYDPEYLLFEKLLNNNDSFLGNVQVHLNGRVSDLISVYNDANNSYSIEHILEFQHILIKVIADVFYAQIYNLTKDSRYGIIYLTNLHSTFEEYTNNMLPSNCSISVCNKILKAQVYLKKVLSSYNYSIESDVLRKLKNHFEPENNIELINHNTFQDFADQSLSFLFHNMWDEKQFKSFSRVINLLSHESYSNSDFYIVKVSDHVKIADSQTYDQTFLKSMIELQYSLISFWTLLKKENDYQFSNNTIRYSTVDFSDLLAIGFTTPQNYNVNNKSNVQKVMCHECKEYVSIFADVLRVIVKFYNNLDDTPSVQNILLPLLLHFQHTYEHFVHASDIELINMLQISFLTITMVENYLIKHYSFAFFSLFIYSKFIMNDGNGPDRNKLQQDLHTYAETSTINLRDTLNFLNDLYDVNSNNSVFPEDDKQIEFLWNGSKQFGYDIIHNFIKGVTDFNDFISFQWFWVKWYLSNILLKIMNALILHRYKRSEQLFTFIKSTLLELLTHEFPMNIKTFLDDVVNATLAPLNTDQTNLDDNTFDQWQIVFFNSLKVLDAHPSYNQPLCSEVETIMSGINSEIKNLKNLIQSNFLGTQHILISTDLCLSSAKTKFSDKIIKILNQIN